MATVRGCVFPETLLYDVPRHVWYSPAADGLVRSGITAVGVMLAREVLIFTPKPAGRRFEKDRAIATVESAKWVGSVRAAFAGRIEAVNEALLPGAASINADPYGAGWMVLLRPVAADWSDGLVIGAAIGRAYADWMEREGFAGCAESPD